ncbi:MAG: inorganic phosphate transporter [Dysgonamonadaceae bacterium]|jgi:PiT family inorganic phosphate transporter|nr:inorganic phosphate transporter [Dysgonamonadaceae bacterium]
MTLLFIIIFLALAFDFVNGFHDAANSISTVVVTKVLTPLQAVLWAAFFNFLAFFYAKYVTHGFKIADTIAKAVDKDSFTGTDLLHVVLAGIIAAIIWNLFTWWRGIPSSSSHTLIGGFAGAAIALGGFSAIHSSVIGKIILFIFLAPLIGFIASIIITSITLHIVKKSKPAKIEKWFRRLQLVSSAWLSLQHGLNDSPKVMGIICVALIAFNKSIDPASIPHWLQLSEINDVHDWVPFACFTAIALGTMSGGWKIIKTMGNKITKIQQVEGFCAQTAGSLTLTLTEHFGIPVSTSHVITGSIMGVGSVKRLSAVRWGITIDMLWAWILTIPVSALLAAGVYWIIQLCI